jgi:exocyst complex component 2
LAVASHKADTLFLPLLSNSLKAQKLKSTLNVFERSKFLFGLPRNLRTNIQAGRYDAALRDYNKGHYLYSSRPHQLLPITSSGSAASSPGLVTEENGDSAAALKRKEQQKRVVGKIWAEVEKIMDEMKEELEGVLRQPNGKDEKGIEHVEKCLEWVSVEDPPWTNVSH